MGRWILDVPWWFWLDSEVASIRNLWSRLTWTKDTPHTSTKTMRCHYSVHSCLLLVVNFDAHHSWEALTISFLVTQASTWWLAWMMCGLISGLLFPCWFSGCRSCSFFNPQIIQRDDDFCLTVFLVDPQQIGNQETTYAIDLAIPESTKTTSILVVLKLQTIFAAKYFFVWKPVTLMWYI